MTRLNLASTLALAFGLTLASASWVHAADDTGMSDTSGYSGSSQRPGTMGSTESKETTTHTEHWKSMKSCTDESGVTYKRGQKGFKTCMEAMRKKEQMGGTQPGQPESGMSGGMSGGTSSGTSNTGPNSGTSGSTSSDTTNQ